MWPAPSRALLAAALLRAARRGELHDLVRAVAERPDARLAAAAQRDRLALDRNVVAVLIAQSEFAADQQRPVAVGRDLGHGAGLPGSTLGAIGVEPAQPAGGACIG